MSYLHLPPQNWFQRETFLYVHCYAPNQAEPFSTRQFRSRFLGEKRHCTSYVSSRLSQTKKSIEIEYCISLKAMDKLQEGQ